MLLVVLVVLMSMLLLQLISFRVLVFDSASAFRYSIGCAGCWGFYTFGGGGVDSDIFVVCFSGLRGRHGGVVVALVVAATADGD